MLMENCLMTQLKTLVAVQLHSAVGTRRLQNCKSVSRAVGPECWVCECGV